MNTNFNILLLTHGPFGPAIIESSKMILGASSQLDAIPLELGMSPEDYIAKVRSYLEKSSQKTLILTDVFGGTTSNVALMLSQDFDLTIACGLNLGLLLEVLTKREFFEGDLESLVKESVASASELSMLLKIEEED